MKDVNYLKDASTRLCEASIKQDESRRTWLDSLNESSGDNICVSDLRAFAEVMTAAQLACADLVAAAILDGFAVLVDCLTPE